MASLEQIIDKCIDYQQNSRIVSLPLQFAYLPVDILSKQYTKLNSPHQYRIHYLGPRYTNTQTMHKKCAYNQLSPSNTGVPDRKINKYSIDIKRIANSFFINEKLRTNHFYKTGLYYRAFQGMNPTLDIKNQLIFNAGFQSGNLDCVIKIKPQEYDLFLRIDSNTRGHLQWFYFSIENGNFIGKIKINICNISKPGTFYQQLMQPYIFSRKNLQKYSQGWIQGSPNITNVNFSQKPFNYKILNDKVNFEPFCYSFQYQFKCFHDQVYFSYCIPYTYSQLMHDIQILPSQNVKKYSLGRSLTGVQIPFLHLTDHNSLNTQAKRNIIITGRIHPTESNSSHVLKGFINFLCSKQKLAIQLCRTTNFFIIPMMNPDGVIIGNSRCSASGRDLNRMFTSTDKEIFPQINYLKSFTGKFLNFEQILMYFDFHGHSRRKNTFFYGPAYTIGNPNHLKCRVLPRLIQKINCGFRYHSCLFSISESKKSTGRAAMFQFFQIPYTYTIQSSICSYYDSEKLKTILFSQGAYLQMGKSIAEGTSTFISALNEYDNLLKQRKAERDRKRNLRIMFKKIDNRALFGDQQEMQIKGPTLKIHYKGQQQCLFIKLLEQVKLIPDITKVSKSENDNEGIDQQASSDDHDQKQDFQISKLKQFNNLVIQNARKDNLMNKLSEQQQNNKLKLFIKSECNNNANDNQKFSRSQRNNFDETDQLQIYREIIVRNKIKSSQGTRVSQITQERSSTRAQIKRNFSLEKQSNKQTYNQSQRLISEHPKFSKYLGLQLESFKDTQNKKVINNYKDRDKKFIKIRSSTVSRSSVSKQEYRKWKIQTQKIGNHFSEMQFPDQQKHEIKKLQRHHKTDLLRKNISRRRQKSDINLIQTCNYSQSTIVKPNKQIQMNSLHKPKNKKMTQFKIQDIMDNLEHRSKILRDSVKYKNSPESKVKSGFVFPSSFYCIRQQLNSKKKGILNRSREKSESGEDHIQIRIKNFNK